VTNQYLQGSVRKDSVLGHGRENVQGLFDYRHCGILERCRLGGKLRERVELEVLVQMTQIQSLQSQNVSLQYYPT
jgi:hypothetical protein